MAHTPGPWRTFNGTDVYPDDADIEGTRHIADCGMTGILTASEQAANAKLIAEAPAMLAALALMTELCAIKYGNLDADVWAEIEKARAIITKATA